MRKKQKKRSMKKVRESIRLNEQSKLSQRQIAKALSLSRPTVKEYITQIASSGLNYGNIQAMSDEELLEIISNKSNKNKRLEILQSKFMKFAKELKRVGVTRRILWDEYIQENPDGFSYSQFCHHFQKWQKSSDVVMHFDHKAGDKLFVDFTGKKLSITDKITGSSQEVEVFVAVLGASQFTYVQAVMSQKKEDWLRATENALQYIQGVPSAIVPDNLKSAVTKADKYEPEINPEYLDFSRHYKTTILPTRPYSPRDKAMVEGAVRIVYSWIFARLRNEIFYSLEDLNRAIYELLDDYNSRKMQKLDISRMDLFNEIERSELQPLPVNKYELKHYKNLTVQFNYHIYLSDDKHHYSVPFRYKGKQVEVLYTDRTIDIYYKNVRIAFHKRSSGKNRYTTNPDHMPPKHRWKDNWDPDKLISWGRRIGPSVETVIERILGGSQHPEQLYKTCMGILNLTKNYSNIKLNKACSRALYYENCSYKFIKNMLQNGMEEVQEEYLFDNTLPYHKNIRGNQYYEKGEDNEQPSYN